MENKTKQTHTKKNKSKRQKQNELFPDRANHQELFHLKHEKPQPLLACRDKTFTPPHESSYKLFLVYNPIRSSQQSPRLFHSIWFLPVLCGSFTNPYTRLFTSLEKSQNQRLCSQKLQPDNTMRSPCPRNAGSFTALLQRSHRGHIS